MDTIFFGVTSSCSTFLLEKKFLGAARMRELTSILALAKPGLNTVCHILFMATASDRMNIY